MLDEISNLLVLQERDRALFELELQIARAPSAKAEILARISQAQADFKRMQDEVKNLESSRMQMRSDRLANEEKIAKLKIQQALVKKNDEYQALLKAIENAQLANSENEELELELLFKIDEAKAQLEISSQNHAQTMKTFEAELEKFERNYSALLARLDEARFKVRDAEKNCSQAFLDAYKFAKNSRKSFPIVCPVSEGKCSCCHLKISGSAEAELKRSPDPVFCENCGRIIFNP